MVPYVYALVLDPLLKRMEERLAGEGIVRAYQDDVLIAGKHDTVLEHLDSFVQDLAAIGGELAHGPGKNSYYSPSHNTEGIPSWLTRGSATRPDGTETYGFELCGVALGELGFIHLYNEKRFNEVEAEIKKNMDLLATHDAHIAHTLGSKCFQHKLDWLMQTNTPGDISHIVRRSDDLVRYMVGKSYLLDDPTRPDGTEPSTHPGFSASRIHMPCRFKGTGFTLPSERHHAAFTNALMMSVPQMVCRDGHTPGYYELLRPTLDHSDPAVESAFKDFEKSDLLPHWAPFLASRSPISAELHNSFSTLRETLSNLARPEHQPDHPDAEPLCESLAGDLDTTKPVNTKSFQKSVSHTFYQLKYLSLCDQANDLDNHDPRRLAFTNSDEFSIQLFSAYPTNEFVPTSLVFREASRTLLGLPSLLCRHHVNQLIRNSTNSTPQRVDAYGLALTRVNGLKGSSRTPLHNAIQKTMACLLRRFGYTATENPVDLFMNPITEEMMQAIQSGDLADYQSTIIPDLVLRSPTDSSTTVVDFKTLSDSHSYTHAGAVNKRANEVKNEYKRTARLLDTLALGYPRTHRRPEDQIGPREAQVAAANVEGLVFGTYSEVSNSVRALIKKVADDRACEAMRSMGCENLRHATQVIKEMFRKKLGLVASIEWAKLRVRVFYHGVSKIRALDEELVDEGEQDYLLLRNPGLNGPVPHSWRH